MWIQGDKRVVYQKDVHIYLNILVSNVMIKHSQDPEGTKHGAGYVTSASDDDDHRAHTIIFTLVGS